MNILEATEQIEGAVEAYLAKDDHGLHCIPFHMQRPIIILGPPGVGKTAIVAQIADKLGINLVSYAITHHTRQTALGLPFIVQETFEGKRYSVSEYTMSEIIAAVYRARAESGVDEGILFLDEVNCVSETLAPAMLQFLQYKTFGMHRLPEGWVIVCAGNPPEYNRAAREFDPAMLDRLMKISVEPDVNVWQEYAAAHGVHPAVTTYLDAKPGNFYNVRAGAQGSKIVTSRGWEDLSRMIQAYERLGKTPPDSMPERYLQDKRIAEDFSVYYELFRKYRSDYKISQILSGDADDELRARACKAAFDERIALIGLLLDAVRRRVHDCVEHAEALKLANVDLKCLKDVLDACENPGEAVDEYAEGVKGESGVGKRLANQVGDKAVVKSIRLRLLDDVRLQAIKGAASGEKKPSACARAALTADKKRLTKDCNAVRVAMNNAFVFLDQSFGDDSQESLIFVTKLSVDRVVIKFVTEFSCEQFMKHNKTLLLSERGTDLLAELEGLEE